jgi:hypothetical protein
LHWRNLHADSGERGLGGPARAFTGAASEGSE